MKRGPKSKPVRSVKKRKKRRNSSQKDVTIALRLPIKLVKRIERFQKRLARDEDVMASPTRAFAIRELLVTGLQHAEALSIPRCVTAKLTKDVGKKKSGPRRSSDEEKEA